MNYFLYGPDTYRSRGKLREIIDAYREKHAGGVLDLHRFDAAEDDLQEFRLGCRGGSLFAAKKLIVLERPFTVPHQFDIARSALADAQSASADMMVVVWDGALDAEAKKRFKDVETYIDKSQEFTPLSGTALQRWIAEEAVARGAALSPAERTALAMSCGGDLWTGSQEIEKAALGRAAGAAAPAARHSVFDLGDSFFLAPVPARRILLSLIRAGEDEMGLFTYLASHARKLLVIKSYSERGVSPPASAKIHPFVVKKASRQVAMLSLENLTRALSRFLEEDRRIKTGMSTARESLLRMLG
ncbi:MAG: hypothetical protein AAB533_04220 [Patescibacteria group bacterium]